MANYLFLFNLIYFIIIKYINGFLYINLNSNLLQLKLLQKILKKDFFKIKLFNIFLLAYIKFLYQVKKKFFLINNINLIKYLIKNCDLFYYIHFLFFWLCFFLI